MKKAPLPENRKQAPKFVSRQVPLYYQLETVLRQNISSGKWAVGHRLPSEAELGSEYGVSRITVRQALAPLEAEGLLRREAGRGTFVKEAPKFTGTLKLEGSLDDFISIVKTTSAKVISVEKTQASPEEAGLLGLEPGAAIIRCVRVRSHRSEPYSLVVNDIPYQIGKKLSKVDWAGPISDILQKKLGIQMGDARQSIRASLADVETSRILGIRVGAPLLSVDRVVYTEDGTPMDRVLTHYRSDIFSFTVHLRKGHSLGDSAPERVSQNTKLASRTGSSKPVTAGHRKS
jgi:DNA-binding GntR family transcriptional regulator